MALFWKATAATLITVILTLTLGKQGKDMSVLLSMSVCCMVACAAISFLEPVLEFFRELEALANIRGNGLDVLLKVLGISLVAEISAMVCTDAGSSSLGRVIQMLGSAAMLWLSVPVFRMLLEVIQKILGEL